jgi:very-short-patch-repair endonuclease
MSKVNKDGEVILDAAEEYVRSLGLDTDTVKRSLYLRQNMSKPEAYFWKVIGKFDNPWGILPQIPVEGYFADFMSPSSGAIVEVDGPFHLFDNGHDAVKEKVLSARGFRMLHLTPADLKKLSPLELFEMIDGLILENEDDAEA